MKPLPKEGVFLFSPMHIPNSLKAGDKVAVVNPAKRLQSDMAAGLDILKSWGLEPVVGTHAREAHNLFAGDDSQRQADLQWALDDPEIKAIIIARGGYGTTRILDELSFDKFMEQPKWICGFSDITSLLCRLDNLGVASIHGPMVASMGRNDDSDDWLKTMLLGGDIRYELTPRKESRAGRAKGALIGGNLTMICNSIGTSSEIDTRDKILFLEEVGEYIYHLDRMLIHMLRAGKLSSLRGVIVGDFSSMKDHNDTFGLSTREVLSSQLNHLGCPVLYGFPGGHEHKNLPIPFGVEVELSVEAAKATVEFSLG